MNRNLLRFSLTLLCAAVIGAVAGGCVSARGGERAEVPEALIRELELLQEARSEGYTTYTVRRGDTVWSISKRWGTTVDAICRTNGISDPTVIEVGQQLVIPVREGGVAGEVAEERVAGGQGGLAWPVSGRVVRRFGEKVGGVPYRGIDIQTSPGEGVVAIDGGRVVFVSEAFEGLGKVVAVAHGGGVWALYGGLGGISVGLDDRVSRGERIGEAPYGVGSARIHFRVFKDGELRDPMKLLP